MLLTLFALKAHGVTCAELHEMLDLAMPPQIVAATLLRSPPLPDVARCPVVASVVPAYEPPRPPKPLTPEKAADLRRVGALLPFGFGHGCTESAFATARDLGLPEPACDWREGRVVPTPPPGSVVATTCADPAVVDSEGWFQVRVPPRRCDIQLVYPDGTTERPVRVVPAVNATLLLWSR